MTWEKGKTEMTCEHCGAVNVVEYTDYPERDKGEVFCARCGGSLHKWKGTRDFGIAVLKEKLMTDKPKRPRDASQLAKFIVDVATGEEPEHEPDTSGQRKGGIKGGKERAKQLTPDQRSEIASIAAAARWKKSDD